MTKLQWVKRQIQTAGNGNPNFLGELKSKLLLSVKEAGKGMTRTQFWKLFEQLRPEESSLYNDYMMLDNQLCLLADFSEVWDVSKAPLLPELKGTFHYGAVELPSDFIKLGGEPGWIQSESFPICESCDCDMGFVLQICPLPYELTRKHKKLIGYNVGGGSCRLYLFRCPHCSSFQTSIQCD